MFKGSVYPVLCVGFQEAMEIGANARTERKIDTTRLQIREREQEKEKKKEGPWGCIYYILRSTSQLCLEQLEKKCTKYIIYAKTLESVNTHDLITTKSG